MKLEYSGIFNVNKDINDVFKNITDIKYISRAFPVKEISEAGPDEYAVKMELGIGPLKGIYSGNLKLLEKKPPNYGKVAGSLSGAGSRMTYEIEFKLSGADTTSVEWFFKGDAGGLIASFGKRILDNIAKDLINDIINKLKSLLEQ